MFQMTEIESPIMSSNRENPAIKVDLRSLKESFWQIRSGKSQQAREPFYTIKIICKATKFWILAPHINFLTFWLLITICKLRNHLKWSKLRTWIYKVMKSFRIGETNSNFFWICNKTLLWRSSPNLRKQNRLHYWVKRFLKFRIWQIKSQCI